MSTHLLYHGFGPVGYTCVTTQYREDAVIFTVAHKRDGMRCSVRKGTKLTLRGATARRFRTVPVGSRKVYVELEVERVRCKRCRHIRQVNLGFADLSFSYARAFERYALELSGHMTILEVARHLHISWDVVKDIEKRYLKKEFSHPGLKDIRHTT